MEYEEVRNFTGTEESTVQQNDILIPGLSNDVAILCLARVSRSYHHNMRGVSPSWRNLLKEKVFFDVRRELSLAEEWLYLWIESESDHHPNSPWHCFDPSLNKWSKLPPIPHHTKFLTYSSFACGDGKIFVIGGLDMVFDSSNTHESHVPSKIAFYFDTRSYSWKRIADLNMARASCKASIIDSQLYVFGGFKQYFYDHDSKSRAYLKRTTSVEVYDSVHDTWTFVSKMKFPMDDGVAMGGKFYVCGGARYGEDVPPIQAKGAVYDPKTDEWEDTSHGLISGWDLKVAVMNGKLYTLSSSYYGEDDTWGKHIEVYNPSADDWELVSWFWGQDLPMDCHSSSKVSCTLPPRTITTECSCKL